MKLHPNNRERLIAALRTEKSDALLQQHKAHCAIVNVLVIENERLNKECDELHDRSLIAARFIEKHPQELVVDYVKFAYETAPNLAKEEVEYFNDNGYELSDLPCTGDDF